MGKGMVSQLVVYGYRYQKASTFPPFWFQKNCFSSKNMVLRVNKYYYITPDDYNNNS